MAMPASSLAPSPTDSLTAKGRSTRQRILVGARKAFEQTAYYSETRIADIVEAAGVAYGSFYRYFDSKEQLFYELAIQVVDEMFVAGRSEYRGNDPLSRIDSSNRRFLKAYQDHHVMMTVIEQAAALHLEFRGLRRHLRDRFVHGIASNIRQLAEEGLVDPGLDPFIAAHALVSMTDNFGYVWIVLGEPFEEEQALENMTRLWSNALRLHLAEADSEVPPAERRPASLRQPPAAGRDKLARDQT